MGTFLGHIVQPTLQTQQTVPTRFNLFSSCFDNVQHLGLIIIYYARWQHKNEHTALK